MVLFKAIFGGELGSDFGFFFMEPCAQRGWEAACLLCQSCPTLCNPMHCSPTGSPVPGILQAGTLEWVAISFSNAGK